MPSGVERPEEAPDIVPKFPFARPPDAERGPDGRTVPLGLLCRVLLFARSAVSVKGR